ncbi:MAG: hypothetical protein HC831_05425 [Chloroflexia bacterium]|nr:hypothetical protein [Chloroflexia bacterium]
MRKVLRYFYADSESNGGKPNFGTYLAGDFHQHTTFTDGSWTMGHVMSKNNEFGLDWWTNSEHGGGFNRDGRTSGTDLEQTIYWDEVEGVAILGTESYSGGHQNMWRWQALRDYSFAALYGQRKLYPNKSIMQGFEWNVPGHEHASVCILGDQFKRQPNVNALAEFEFKFDAGDADLIGGVAQGWVKSTNQGHEKTLEAISWLQANHPRTSWVVPAHPERKQLYTIADFRDMNNAGPSVCFGFESMPGHQKSSNRGGYSSSADGGGTYGGCGIYAAKIGGLWDAMLSEGRRFWLFASSDFHDVDGDFYPGEYQKTYTSVKSNNPQSIADGLRSGNSYIVCGDLIRELEFSVETAVMGQTYLASKDYVTVKIKLRNNGLNHFDLVAGEVNGYVAPGDADYNNENVSTTKVIARFDAVGGVTDANGTVSQKWEELNNNWVEVSIQVPVNGDMYFRLRGTNWALNTSLQTDEMETHCWICSKVRTMKPKQKLIFGSILTQYLFL